MSGSGQSLGCWCWVTHTIHEKENKKKFIVIPFHYIMACASELRESRIWRRQKKESTNSSDEKYKKKIGESFLSLVDTRWLLFAVKFVEKWHTQELKNIHEMKNYCMRRELEKKENETFILILLVILFNIDAAGAINYRMRDGESARLLRKTSRVSALIPSNIFHAHTNKPKIFLIFAQIDREKCARTKKD